MLSSFNLDEEMRRRCLNISPRTIQAVMEALSPLYLTEPSCNHLPIRLLRNLYLCMHGPSLFDIMCLTTIRSKTAPHLYGTLYSW